MPSSRRPSTPDPGTLQACPECGQALPQLRLAPSIVEHKARRSDPTTSKLAAVRAFPRAGSQRRRILDALDRAPYGYTVWELHERLGLPYVSVSTRVSELKRGHWARPSGDTRTTGNGGEAEILVLTGRAHRELLEQRQLAAQQKAAA